MTASNPSCAASSPLGRASAYPDTYDPTQLYPIERAPKREEIGITGTPRFLGCDLWTAYELSWLNARGKPQVAMAHISVPCESTHLVESKSLKLYLNSFNNSRFADVQEVQQAIERDVSQALWLGATVRSRASVHMVLPEHFDQQTIEELSGLSLDRLDIECDRYTPAPELLTATRNEQPVTETLTSQLLKSNCLVTGQPDWASIQISYSGPQIDQEGLLRYLISFRNHNEFHEQCVERIYMDIWHRCKPTHLTVYARYTRRGGLDISPYRTSHPGPVPRQIRSARQ
ncbi:MAG: 7-cyano-7-deazaguanine reductase [Pseudomonadota bacterium]|jgi:7-cyano-7-deazaguanine reductase